MVLVAIGVLLATISALAYRYKDFFGSRSVHSDYYRSENDKDITGEDTPDNKPVNTPQLNIDGKEESVSHDGSPTKRRSPNTGAINPNAQVNLELQKSTAPNQSMPPPRIEGPRLPSSLMPPPSQTTPKPTSPLVPPKPPTALRPPRLTAATLRVPPQRSQQSSSSFLAPSTSTLPPPSRPSKKVLLEPGHSPLDWAHLTANPPTPTFLRGADVPPNLIRVPPSLLKYHNGRKDKTGKRKDAWGVYQGRVYNMTPYLDFHPGGRDQLMRGAGKEKDSEKLFNEIHPWVSWENMLGECLVGIFVSENEASVAGGMEDMD